MDLAEVDRLYEAASTCHMDRLAVDHAGVRGFAQSLGAFQKRLGTDASDEYWLPVLRILRRARWELSSVPLPLDHPGLDLVFSAEAMRDRLRDVADVYPRVSEPARLLLEQVEHLAQSEADPLGDAVVELLAKEKDESLDSGVLLKNASMGTAVRQHLGQRGVQVTPVIAEGLRRQMGPSRLIAIGPRRWFPTYVTAAPRTKNLTFVHFRWIRDPDQDDGAFPVSLPGSSSIQVPAHPLSEPAESGESFVEAEDLLPRIDWEAIVAQHAGPREDEYDPDVASASLYALAGGLAVYLDASPGARTYVVDLEGDEGRRVHQEVTSQIDSGHFVLLRSEGGGDYIRAVADRILREDAARLRTLQEKWKELLRDKIRSQGLHRVTEQLSKHGCDEPSKMNVRYWSSRDSIATGEYRDFQAILRFVRLENEADDLWSAMKMIRAAHVRAGQHIRRLLSARVVAADVSELRERGVMHFDLGAQGGGKLSAYRVEAKAPQQVTLSRRQLRHPFTLERDLWHG